MSDGLGLTTASRAVAQQLRHEIERGELQPGTRLRQIDIAKRLGVSTTPVREALALLGSEGLVRHDPRRGAVVFHPTEEDLIECFKIRMALEPLALTEALPSIPDEAFDELEQLIVAMREMDDRIEWLEANERFHGTLYAGSNNQRLLEMIDTLRKASRYYIHLFVVHEMRSHRADDEHRAILNACRQRDPELATAAARDHLERTMNSVLEFLRSDDGPADALLLS